MRTEGEEDSLIPQEDIVAAIRALEDEAGLVERDELSEPRV